MHLHRHNIAMMRFANGDLQRRIKRTFFLQTFRGVNENMEALLRILL